MAGVYPVILCGGSGSRLWPTSRPDVPKQFITLVGERSTFQQTVMRVTGIKDADAPIIVAGPRHVALIREQLRSLEVEATLLIEPEGRDSAPAIAAAAVWIAARTPSGVALVVSSDHHIPDAAEFQRAAEHCALIAQQGWIVTLGLRPTSPSTAFGYIQPGPRSPASALFHPVAAFVEKPDAATAADYVDNGYLWNSGNFVGVAERLLSELDLHAPAVSYAARRAVGEAEMVSEGAHRLGAAFAQSPKISIDYAVMEKTERAAVLPAAFAWSDLGAWDAVRAASPTDAEGNATTGDAVLVDTVGCLVRNATQIPVGLLGVSDLAVVVEADGILVTSLSASQSVKRLAERVLARPCAEARPIDDLRCVSVRLQSWFDANALPLWWTLGADHERGGFHESLDQAGRATSAPRRARVQARQIFVYASAGAEGWPGPWRTATEHGLRYFLDRYRRSDNLFRSLVSYDGDALDERAMLYDQAFALLSEASLFRLDPSRSNLLIMAGALLDRIRSDFAHAGGGFREASAQPFQSNPLMHLFEAALAWAEAGGGELWDNLADEIAALALSRLIDSKGGAIREFYADDWRPAEGPAGLVVLPGHQFEWAWLLDRWARRSGDAAARSAAYRLFEIGSAGVDRARSVAVDAMDDALSVTDGRARLWPQSERLKAALALSEGVGSDDRARFLAEALDAAQSLWRYLETPTAGLWRDQMSENGRFAEGPSPASSLYHICGAVHELRRFNAAALAGLGIRVALPSSG